MAIYTYRCPSCSKQSDVIRNISDPEDAYNCDSCDVKLVRVFGSPGVIFNGSGFYSKDK